ncbi:MAG TPA: TIGR03435 family protein [Bryobacteraceae bacterium]|nr:TIGR03435 family protein [Bryobacteraceae bacterium]
MARTNSRGRIACIGCLIVWCAVTPHEIVAQEFDVASVKINKSGVFASSLERSGGQLTLRNASLRECIELAYGVLDKYYALSGPSWLDADRYDIVAKASTPTPREQLLLMLRRLLADRFDLKIHREKRSVRVYTLVVARGGPKITTASGVESNFTFGAGHITASEMSMAEFADRLAGPVFQLGIPVIDSTGLRGTFDFSLDWSPGDAAAEAIARPSLFTAIEEQLGLKLRPGKRTIDIWVVDHVERVAVEN